MIDCPSCGRPASNRKHHGLPWQQVTLEPCGCWVDELRFKSLPSGEEYLAAIVMSDGSTWERPQPATCSNCRRDRPIVAHFNNPARGYCAGCWNPFNELIGDPE